MSLAPTSSFAWSAENLTGSSMIQLECILLAQTGLVEVFKEHRVSYSNDEFCSGRSLFVFYVTLQAALDTSWGWVMVMVCIKLLHSCDAAFLLLIWSVVSSSDKLLIKVAIEVSQHEMKPCFMNFSFSLWPTIIFSFSHSTRLCYFTAEGSQQNFHCKAFYFILFYI